MEPEPDDIPFTLETAPCRLGFDFEAELFAHYAWHIDQLEIDHECPVTTCRMKILSDEHLEKHYKQMHPDLPAPAPEPQSSSASTTKPTGRAAVATTTTAAATAKAATSKPTSQHSYVTPVPPAPTKSRSQSKLQQTRMLSEGGKLKTGTDGSTPSKTTTVNHKTTTAYQLHTTTKGRLATTIHSDDDDEDEDNTPPMALGPFFKR
ncbi:hypothetical protein BGZ96_011346 [Linnemannia gamsii]|uniref:C2H2-type domain-containing protein n=1 Tax=Linnemannia gamsii TaxID=64522 RepID=A0ABQ7JSS5_9FUNG|nr:hypothetical protein BGZ96_011346 [Linnemannia gamsii]